ncbi:MAG: flagellar hook assembly protein FlgD, partial [Desulfovibrionaceae bacterium]|nr:flagellar hook assembly protein FlgD [Desulfovibrionaceae bacterium]
MSTTSLNSILNQADNASQGATSRTEADKDMFLKLLVAQLTHQDPLNPVEDKEFIAQLAQFTSVEELQNIGKGINKINEAYDRDQLTSAAAMLGMRVISQGNTLTKVSDPETGETGATTVWYSAP